MTNKEYKLYSVDISHKMVVLASSKADAEDIAQENYDNNLKHIERYSPSVKIWAVEEIKSVNDLPEPIIKTDKPLGPNDGLTCEEFLEIQETQVLDNNSQEINLSLSEKYKIFKILNGKSSGQVGIKLT